ncbi:hypothetical protein BH24ACT8_BH24ACT8_01150 [soil metagenome]
MGATPTVILIAALCVATTLPMLAWSFTARPGAARQRTVANLNRDFMAGGAVQAGPKV